MTTPFKTQRPTAPSKSRTRSLKRDFLFSNVPRSLLSVSNKSSWLSQFATLALLLGLLAAAFHGAANAQDPGQDESLALAVSWLVDQQGEDGGFPGFTGESDPATTADAVVALAAAQTRGVDVQFDAALGYLGSNALLLAETGPGSAAKLSLALTATGQDPHDFELVDPLSIVQSAAGLGMIGFGPFEHALGLLALVAAGEQVPEEAIAAVYETQGENGGWAFDGSVQTGAEETNTTAMMVQAMVAAGLDDDEAVTRAVEYLLAAQSGDGGFPYQPGGPSDANSTSLSLQALLAVGNESDDPSVASAETALAAFQNDNGSFSWMLDPRDDNMFATMQAIPAQAGLTLPIVQADVATPVTATPEANPAARLASA